MLAWISRHKVLINDNGVEKDAKKEDEEVKGLEKKSYLHEGTCREFGMVIGRCRITLASSPVDEHVVLCASKVSCKASAKGDEEAGSGKVFELH